MSAFADALLALLDAKRSYEIVSNFRDPKSRQLKRAAKDLREAGDAFEREAATLIRRSVQ